MVRADAPAGALDSATGAAVVELIPDLAGTFGAVIATREAAVAARCDRVVRMSDGRIVADEK